MPPPPKALSQGMEKILCCGVIQLKASSVPGAVPPHRLPPKAQRSGGAVPTWGAHGPLGASPPSPAAAQPKGAAVSSAGPKPCQLEQALFAHQTQTNPEVRGKPDKIHCFGPLQSLVTRVSKRSSEIHPCLRAIKTRSHM